ncbi:MAG: hypothetical protein ACREHG_10870, partial [Candidatus Saccharimonadales bacterium]
MKPDLNSVRAKEARLAAKIGQTGGNLLLGLSLASAAIGIARELAFSSQRWIGWLVLALAALLTIVSTWYFKRLAILPANLNSQKLEDKLAAGVLALLPKDKELNPKMVWRALAKNWQLIFITNHLLLAPEHIEPLLAEQPSDMDAVWQKASEITSLNSAKAIEPGFVATALLATSPAVGELVKQIKLQAKDIEEIAGWLARGLEAMNNGLQNSGGIGRDWAFGFTPLLDRFGVNISLQVAGRGSHFGWLARSDSVRAIEGAFENHAGAVALIGAPGSGKTSHVYALAQKLISGDAKRALAYHQIVSIDAGQIVGSARGPGDLEHIVRSLASEAAHAGHI